MTAEQLIEHFQILPAVEQEKVKKFMLSGQNTLALHEREPVRYASMADVEKIGDEVFTKYSDLFKKLAE